MLNSEDLLNQCVRKMGGQRVDEIVGSSPAFSNADYFFDQANIVAETKAFEKDFLTAKDVQEKLHRLNLKWMEAGKVPIVYGQRRITTDQLPKECVYELIDVFRQPLKEHLQKANGQIKEVRRRFNRPDALGLVLLSNEGNYALDPEMTLYCLHHLLKSQLTAIEYVVYLSANLLIPVPGTPWRVPPFYPISLGERRQPTDEFLLRLGANWFSVLGEATGTTLPPFTLTQGSPEDIRNLAFHAR